MGSSGAIPFVYQFQAALRCGFAVTDVGRGWVGCQRECNLVWEAHVMCWLRYCRRHMLNAFRTLPVQEISWASCKLDLWLHLPCIDCLDWARVLLVQSSCYFQFTKTHEWSLGRSGDGSGYVWIDLVTAEVVEGICAKRQHTQSVGLGLRIIGEVVTSETKPRARKKAARKLLRFLALVFVECVADVIISYGSDSGKTGSTASAWKVLVGMNGAVSSSASQKSMVISEDARAASGDTSCEEGQPGAGTSKAASKICARTKFLKSSIAWLHLFLGEITILSTKDLQSNAPPFERLDRWTLLGLQYRCAGTYSSRVRSSDRSTLGLEVDSAEPILIGGPALMAVRH